MTHDGLKEYDGGYGVVEKIEVKACIPKTTSIHVFICHLPCHVFTKRRNLVSKIEV